MPQSTSAPWMRRQAPAHVNELCDIAQAWAESYYTKIGRDGQRRPTREHLAIRDALKPLRAVAGDRPPDTLSAEDLCHCQQCLLEQGISRPVINSRVNRIRRIVKWATRPPRRWIPVDVLTDMQLVEPLKPGRTEAPETEGPTSVSWDVVSDTISRANLQLASMIELQWHTGMRCCELVGMTVSELSEHEDLVLYRPADHKSQHHGVERLIWIGPEGQRVLRSWIAQMPTEAESLWSLRTTNSYRQAIARVIRKHNLAHWYPLQIRHAFATRVERGGESGKRSAQLLLGHSEMHTTSLYIDPDMQSAMQAIRQLG